MGNVETAMALKFLEMRTDKEIDEFPNEYWIASKNWFIDYLKRCPLEELPKHVGSPIIEIKEIKEIIKRRLSGGGA